MALSLQQIAKALSGEIRGDQVAAPGPGHSAVDRTLSVKITANGDDVIVNTFSPADDRLTCLKYVREKCGIKCNGNGNGHHSSDELAKLMREAIGSQSKSNGKIIDSYHYTDEKGVVLYEVLRYEPKGFRQRRPDGNGGYIWNLGNVWRVPYRWPELAQYASTTTYLTEGEKDCNRLWEIGLVATTVQGGKWTDEIVAALAGRQILILEDNDEAGRVKAHEAATLLHPVADSVKIIRLPGLPERGDVSDWLDAGHTVDELSAFCNAAPDWSPSAAIEAQPDLSCVSNDALFRARLSERPLPPSKSLVAYPLVAFADVSFSNEIAYLIQGLLPRSGLALVWGPKKCGKSFWIMDVALHVALGWEYRGRKVEQASVIYLALEGQAGYGRRIEAFKQHHNVRTAPFYLLRAAVNLVAKADEIIKTITQQLASVGLIVVDTMNRSLPGSESSDEDMSKYINAAAKFVKQFDCLVVLIHHPGHDESRPRGHSALGAAVDAQIAVRRGADLEIICELELAKDDAAGTAIYSRLQTREIGFDVNGDPIGSMVVVPSDKSPASSSVRLGGINKLAYDSLINAIAEAGERPPASDHIPQNSLVATEKVWTEIFVRSTPGNYSDPDNARRVLVRAATKLKNMNLIGLWQGYAWPCK